MLEFTRRTVGFSFCSIVEHATDFCHVAAVDPGEKVVSQKFRGAQVDVFQ